MEGPSLEQVQEEEWVSKVAWRIVGASESPLQAPQLTRLIRDTVGKYVPSIGQNRTIQTINRWYETSDGQPKLADDTKGQG